jgi:hypothetical protein
VACGSPCRAVDEVCVFFSQQRRPFPCSPSPLRRGVAEERRLVSDAPTNLGVLKRSRKKPEVGDISVMLSPDGKYLFRRVIRTDALGPMKALLIYIYANRSESKEVPET